MGCVNFSDFDGGFWFCEVGYVNFCDFDVGFWFCEVGYVNFSDFDVGFGCFVNFGLWVLRFFVGVLIFRLTVVDLN